MANVLNNTIFNDYTVRPKNISQYTSFRGVVDFSQIGRFNQYEGGYAYLQVISMPPYLKMRAEMDPNNYGLIYKSFKDLIENEFRGFSGIPDIESETATITDGINEAQIINKVTMQTSVELSARYYERQGGLIAGFTEDYLTGIKDKNTQARTYHGLIKNGLMEPDYQNEVFTLMYIITDNTMLRVEKAYLLANAQLVRSPNGDLYSSERGTYENKELDVTFRCFPITGNIVDAAAKAIVEDISGVINTDPNNMVGNTRPLGDMTGKAVLDSTNYRYGALYDAGGSNVADDEDIKKVIANVASQVNMADQRNH